MSYWDHDSYDAALFACWAENDPDRGVGHCARRICAAIDFDRIEAGRGVLDLGCGVGRLMLPFASAWPHLGWVGVDTSDTMLAHAHAEAYRRGVQAAFHRELPPVLFAAAYSVVVFQHLERPVVDEYLRGVADRLLPGAVFRFQVVIDGDEGPHTHPLSHAELLRIGSTWPGSWRIENDPIYPTWAWVTARKE